jgi:hypothetical protein
MGFIVVVYSPIGGKESKLTHGTDGPCEITHCNKKIDSRWYILDGNCQDTDKITCSFCKKVEIKKGA